MKNVVLIPSRDLLKRYARYRGFRSAGRLVFGFVTVIVMFCGYNWWLMVREPSSASIGRSYEFLAPYMVWLGPLILYLVQISDLNKAIREKDFPKN